MRLIEIVERFEEIAKAQPAVKMVVPNNIYDLNSINDAKYGVFGWTQESHVETMDGYIRFNFVFFYVDRLSHDAKNRLEVQSTGISVLSNIIRTMEEEGVQTADDVNYTTFNQRFTDDCAGVMARVGFLVNADSLCGEKYGNI